MDNLGGGEYTVKVNTAGVAQGLDHVQHSSRGAAQGLLALSQAVDDAQYGFKAIVNNIPQIVYMMGGTAGIAGAVGIAAVAVNLLVSHWTQLGALLQSNWSGGAADELAKIADNAERGAAAFEKMATAIKKTDKEKGERAKEAIVEGGGAHDIERRLTDALMVGKQGEGAQGRPGGFGPMTFLLNKLGLGGQSSYEATAEKVRGLIGRAGDGDPQARAEIAAIMGRNPGAFTDEQKAAINADPKAEAQKRLDLQGGRNARKIMEEQKEEERVRQRHQEAIEHEGRRNEKEINKKQFELNRKKQLQALQDQEEALREQEHKIHFDAAMRGNRGSAGGKGLAGVFADLRQGAFESGDANVGKQQLKKLEGIHQELKDLNKKKQGIQRAEFG